MVENRAGAGGVIGTCCGRQRAAGRLHAAAGVADLYDQPGGQEDHAVRHVKDFTPVAFIARSPLLVTASNKLPVKSAKELLDLAKSKPGQITYASSGPGSINQISAELIALSAGVKFMHVPYKGGAPALNDLVGGHVDLYVSSLPQVLPLARSGQAQGACGDQRQANGAAADVPTLEEVGISGFDLWSWWGIVGPAGMPANIVNALNAEIGKMLTSPELGTFLANEGAEAETMTPQQFGDMMRLETERWIKVAREANISID